MGSSRSLLKRLATLRLRNGHQPRKNFRLRRLKISWLAELCSRRPNTTFHSAITISGGATSKEPTGGTRLGRKAISKARKIIRCCRSLILTRKLTRNGRANVCQLKPSLNLPRAAGCPEKPTCGAMSFGPAENGWQTPGRENFRGQMRVKTVLQGSRR